MNWKKLGKAMLVPHIAFLFLLLALAIPLMLYGMLVLGSEHPLTIASYALAFYTLTIWCVRIPQIIRFFLVRYTMQHKPGEKMREEWHRYRICGCVFLVLNMALTVMFFYMVYRNRIVEHHEITTIAMAAYTFTSLTMAILNVIRYRKYNSPAFSASKAISLASACVSMLTLEGTMLATFGIDTERETQQLFLGLSGVAISAFILVMAIYLIAHGNKKIKCMENEYGK